MGKIVRDLIEYYIDECSYVVAPNFKQMNVDFMFPIPCQKPDVENISKVWINPCIYYKKNVKGPLGKSLEGQILTGNGILIEGSLKTKVEYASLNESKSTHTAHIEIPFCTYIVLPEYFNQNSLVSASVLVEDINSTLISPRCIYNNVTLMVIADVC
ncbi:SPOCS domain-containing protein [uncultured Clostridium sp.]|jgi:hypothetical protein|uniref:SPOCS domain-containing protein n=1 Tax=uncultured Clostridium sp. TaxID=59620 RepID=UPI002632F9DB|nr:SPOCS domain-containing protein [uncultured Clostridium sp.]